MRRLEHLVVPGAWIIFPLFVVQALARGRAFGMAEIGDYALPMWVGASLLIVVAGLFAWRTPGMALVAVGIALNLAVVLLNAAMPVAISGNTTVVADRISTMIMYRLIDQAVIAAYLGDVLSVDVPSGPMFLSAGDVVLMVGVCTCITFAMLDLHAGQTNPT